MKKCIIMLSLISFISTYGMQTQNENLVNLYKDAVLENLKNKNWYLDFGKFLVKNPCDLFKKLGGIYWLSIPANIRTATGLSDQTQHAPFIELILTVAQEKNCWIKTIKTLKEMVTHDKEKHIYLLERMAGSALRSYAYFIIENKAKYVDEEMRLKKSDNLAGTLARNYEIIFQRTKRFLMGVPDFYLISAVGALKDVDQKTYEHFVHNALPTQIKDYLQSIPEQFSNVQFSNDEIEIITKNIQSKLNPSHMRRYLKYYIAAGVAVVSVGYLLYKHRTELLGAYKTGGVKQISSYVWEGIKNVPGRISRSISRTTGQWYTKKPLEYAYRRNTYRLDQLPDSFYPAARGNRIATGFVDSKNRFFEYTKDELTKLYEARGKGYRFKGVTLRYWPDVQVIEVPQGTPFIHGNPLPPLYIPR